MKKLLFIFALLVFTATCSMAADVMDIKSAAEFEITVKNSQGVDEVKRVEASTVKVVPGDTVIFVNRYSYTGDKPATDVSIKNAVPEHMLFTEGSAEGKGTKIAYSADNGKTYAAAGKVMIKDAKGKERVAAAADYTNIKWVFTGPLTKGAKGEVSFKAKIK